MATPSVEVPSAATVERCARAGPASKMLRQAAIVVLVALVPVVRGLVAGTVPLVSLIVLLVIVVVVVRFAAKDVREVLTAFRAARDGLPPGMSFWKLRALPDSDRWSRRRSFCSYRVVDDRAAASKLVTSLGGDPDEADAGGDGPVAVILTPDRDGRIVRFEAVPVTDRRGRRSESVARVVAARNDATVAEWYRTVTAAE